MGNYDRAHQWRMMQQRHASGLSNPYFSGGYIAGTSERRASGLQPHCASNDAAPVNSYYTMGEDRGAPHKRSRLTVNAASAAMRSSDFHKSNVMVRGGDSPNSGSTDRETPRLAGLVSYLSPSTDSMPQYSYQQHAVDGYGPPSVSAAMGPSGQEMNSDWFAQRGLSTGMSVSTAPASSYTTTSEMASGSTGLSRQSSLASPTTIFGMENLMAEYESGFYSLWNQPNGGGGIGYDADAVVDRPSSTADAGQVFIPEEELKMDYPQLPDLNQGDLDYIYGSMDTPTSSRGSDLPVDRSYGLGDARNKRERLSDEKGYSGVMSPTQTGLLSPLALNSFRSLARNSTMETKRPAARSNQNSSSYLTQSTSTAAKSVSSPASTMKKTRPPTTTPVAASSPSPSASKRPRSRQCDFPGCDNRARSHQKCKKHGGAHQCMFEGCLKNSQSRGLCIAHGGGSRCKIDGCTRAAQSKGLCKSHGGGEFCAVEGCRKKAHLKHLCRTHGGGVRCKDAKCMKWAQRKGWCMAHAKLVLDP